jgi:hypothetical protein
MGKCVRRSQMAPHILMYVRQSAQHVSIDERNMIVENCIKNSNARKWRKKELFNFRAYIFLHRVKKLKFHVHKSNSFAEQWQCWVHLEMRICAEWSKNKIKHVLLVEEGKIGWFLIYVLWVKQSFDSRVVVCSVIVWNTLAWMNRLSPIITWCF